jgi:ribosomal protein L7Ae-like RNA K-turn-binding protein
VYLVIQATDGATGQVEKVEGLLRARGVPRIVLGTRARLGQALGSPPLTAVGVTQEAWADRLQREAAATADPDTSGPRASEEDQTYAG